MNFIENVKTLIITPLMEFLLAISFIYFLYGVFQFVRGGDPKKIEDAKSQIQWGLIGLFIIVAFSGIMKLVYDTLRSIDLV